MGDWPVATLVFAVLSSAGSNAQGPATSSSTVIGEVGEASLSDVLQSAPPGVTCLKRRVTNNGATPFTFLALAPVADASKLAANGLAVAPSCRISPKLVANYQDIVCDMVTQGNEAVQDRLTEVFGAPPRDLCAAVRKIAPLVGVTARPEPKF